MGKKFQKKQEKLGWVSQIAKEKFQEIDISKVRLAEEIHLSSTVTFINIQKFRQYKELSPIAVRVNEDGYDLVTGLRSFIIAKLFSRNIKAYVTDLTREEFKEKYDLDI